MDFGLKGKVAMVAAGTKGIGLAIAKDLADEGALVSICARNTDNFHAVLSVLGDQHRAYPCDVSKPEELEAWHSLTTQHLGSPDILITNTGGPAAGPWPEMTDAQWQEGFDSTLLNIVRLVRLAVPSMIDKKWGRIVHVTSWVSKEPHALLPISSTLRAGINALTRLQATELAPYGITVNCVLPGHTLTERQYHLAEVRAEREGITPAEALSRQAAAVPMKRLADPEEISRPAVFLCSSAASYITGVNLLVDGGIAKLPG